MATLVSGANKTSGQWTVEGRDDRCPGDRPTRESTGSNRTAYLVMRSVRKIPFSSYLQEDHVLLPSLGLREEHLGGCPFIGVMIRVSG